MRFLYVGRFGVLVDAASVRVYNLGLALKGAGHEVEYLCEEPKSPLAKAPNDSVFHFVFPEMPPKYRLFLEWWSGKKAARKLKELCAKASYDGVILYNVTIAFAKRMEKICRKRGIRLFCDVTEWYDVDSCPSLPLRLYAKAVGKRIEHWDKKADGVFAISPFLKSYYEEQGVPTLQIPPLFVEKVAAAEKPAESIRSLLYAGSPSHKDELRPLLDAVKQFNKDGEKICLTLVGAPKTPDADELAKCGICFFPRVSHKEVLPLLQKSDFTVLLRRQARFSKAGYSTKVAESLYLGVPVFCNEVGGADLDLQDGVLGIKVHGLSEKDLLGGLCRIAALSDEALDEMKKRCYAFGQTHYSVDSYQEAIHLFLQKIVNGKDS